VQKSEEIKNEQVSKKGSRPIVRDILTLELTDASVGEVVSSCRTF
jgi:hypothetical protein